jgi:hypothetical protein
MPDESLGAFGVKLLVVRMIKNNRVRQCPLPGLLCCKSRKIDQPPKSRETRFLDVSSAASLFSVTRRVHGRFWMKRYGPSRRRAQNASATLEIFAPHLKKSFATQSGAKQTFRCKASTSGFDQNGSLNQISQSIEFKALRKPPNALSRQGSVSPAAFERSEMIVRLISVFFGFDLGKAPATFFDLE